MRSPYAPLAALGQVAMKAHAAAWSAMPADAQVEYERRAAMERSNKRDEICGSIAHLKARLNLKRKRCFEDMSQGGQLRVSNCKPDAAQLESLQRFGDSPAIDGAEVRRAREVSMTAPGRPSANVLSRMEEQDIGFDEADAPIGGASAEWVKLMAIYGEHFANTAMITKGPEKTRYCLLLFAKQSPYLVALAPLEPAENVMPMPAQVPQPGEGFRAADELFDHTFRASCGDFVISDSISVGEGEHVFIWPHIAATRGQVIQSHSEYVLLKHFVRGLSASRVVKEGAPAKRSGHKIRGVPDEMLDAYPWLSEFVKPGKEKPVKDRPPNNDQMLRGKVDLAEEECDKIMAALEEKRREFAETGAASSDASDDFVCVITRGPWCQQNLGVDYDAVRAKARGGGPELWCRSRGLPLSSSFTFKVFGEQGAAALAQAWIHKLQHFYDLAKGGSQKEFVYTDEAVRAYSEELAFRQFADGLPPKSKVHQRVMQIRALRPSARARAV